MEDLVYKVSYCMQFMDITVIMWGNLFDDKAKWVLLARNTRTETSRFCWEETF